FRPPKPGFAKQCNRNSRFGPAVFIDKHPVDAFLRGTAMDANLTGADAQLLDRQVSSSTAAGSSRSTTADVREAHREDGRGRSADAPSQIPSRGWKDILLRVYNGIDEDRILMNAAAVTFYALLAIFPAIAALVSVYGLFADPGSIAAQLDTMAGVLPGGAIEVVKDQLTRLTQHGGTSHGIGFLVGLAVSLWSANGGIKSLFDALNTVYEEKEERSFLRLNAVSLTFTLVMIVFLIVAIACVVAAPVALHWLPGFFGTIIAIARWPVIAVLVALALAFIYRYGPNRTEPKW